MHPSHPQDSNALTRRHFALWMTAASLTGCGGGGDGSSAPAPAPGPAPAPAPAPSSLSRLAGGLGGSGFLAGTLMEARLPPKMLGPAFDSQGSLWFVGQYLSEQRVGKITAQGVLSYTALNLQDAVLAGWVDALDRYVVAHSPSGQSGVLISVINDGTPVPLAGQANAPALADGQGAAAQISVFGSALLAGDGLVYFLDRNNGAATYTLRTLSPDGTVKSLAFVPNGTRLIASAAGAVRGFTENVVTGSGQWSELARSPAGVHSWNPLPNQWPGEVHMPLAPVKGSADLYWAFDKTSNTVGHYALDGTRTDMWQLPGPMDAALSSPLTGHLVVHAWRGLMDQSSAESPGELLLLDRVKTPAAVPQPWVGLADQRGHTDGQGDAARFDFERGAYATAEASGPLYVAVGAQIRLPGTPPQYVPAPLRTVTPAGQVASMPVTFPSSCRLLSSAYGYLVTYHQESETLLRTPKGGAGTAWEPWVKSSLLDSLSSEVATLRVDTTGVLWFATRVRPVPVDWMPFKNSGASLIGTISATGQVQVVVGDPQLIHSPDNYPLLEQRPWHMDVTDLAFEGGSSPVSWVLCNRPVLTADRKGVQRHVPELVRLEGATRQSFALPPVSGTDAYSMHYHQLCTLAGRPGEVFISSACAVYRWTVAKGLELLAGQAQTTPGGVRLGALPASLNLVKFISAGPDANSLYVGSENSVLRLGLPG